MGEGLFILLCVVALVIGSRARNTKRLSEKSIKTREKIKRVLSITALVMIGLLLLLFIPSIIQDIRIAIDTRFTIENLLGVTVILVGLFTFISIFRLLRQKA